MSERRISNQEIAQKLRRAGTAKLLRENEAFRKFCLWYFHTAGIFRTTHRADPCLSSFEEGKRALGLQVLDELLAADDSALSLIITDRAALMEALGTGQPQEEPDDGPDDFER